MSLTQFDLVPGGLYRRKDNPNYIGSIEVRMDKGYYVYFLPDGVFGAFLPEYWEGIPITPEILRDWKIGTAFPKNPFYFQVSEIGLKFLDDRCYPDYGREIKYIHQLQRLVLTLTHKPLEGGPIESGNVGKKSMQHLWESHFSKFESPAEYFGKED